MAFDSKKTILLEKTYLYVRASLGFQLEGTSTEKIPTNNGFYRFFVDNLQKSIGNSYVNILYDSQDLTLQCFCSDLYMDELMSSDSSAIEDVVAELKKNTSTILEFENGVSSALQSNHEDNVVLNAKIEEFESGVSSALAANHEDNVVISESVLSFYKDLLGAFSGNFNLSCYPSVDKDYSSPSKGNLSLRLSDFINKYTYQKYTTNDVTYLAKFHCDCYSNLTHQNDSMKFYLNVCNKFNAFTFVNNGKHYPVGYGTFNFIKDGVVTHSYNNFLGSSVNGSNKYYFFEKHSSAPCIFVGFDFEVLIDEYFLNVLCFLDDTFNYGCSSFVNNSLILFGDVCKTASLNQNFDYDFSGGYLDFKFYSSLGIEFLKSFNYTFITDVGEFSFTGVSLGLKYIDGSNLVVCTDFPNLVSSQSFTIRKLLGVRVGLNSYRLPSMGNV